MRQRKFARSRLPHRRGFTLLEVLVALSILVAITALSLAGILLARKKGIEIRTRSDLGLIGMALEAYKGDFGDYPRFDDSNAADAQTAGFSGDPLNIMQDRGARLLCRALLSPGAATVATGGTVGFDGANANEQAPDGADGPGFRIRTGGAGKVWGPYLDASKFKLGNPAAPTDPTSGQPKWDNQYFKDATILDQNGNSILYYPAQPAASPAQYYVKDIAPPGISPATPPVRPLYNAYDNNHYGKDTTTANTKYVLYANQMAYILGDRNLDGAIGTGETAASTLPYLLWTAGSDGILGFGIDPSTGQPYEPASATPARLKTDDVCNFDIPADLRK